MLCGGGERPSLDQALQIRQLRPAARIAILTRHNLPDQMLRARRLRLNGFILKKDPHEELFYALRTILGGGFYTPPSMSTMLRDQVEDQDPMSTLTQREKSVLTLYAQGRSIKEIAVELDVSVKTAETHRNNLGRKLGHPNRSQITAFALKHNLVSSDQLMPAQPSSNQPGLLRQPASFGYRLR
jgi:two-component system nitrate/nitrite response regulator NarL